MEIGLDSEMVRSKNKGLCRPGGWLGSAARACARRWRLGSQRLDVQVRGLAAATQRSAVRGFAFAEQQDGLRGEVPLLARGGPFPNSASRGTSWHRVAIGRRPYACPVRRLR
jgi:hypothetical protein